MPGLLLIILAFLAAVLAVFGAYSFFADLLLRDRTNVNRRVDEEFRLRTRDRVKKSTLFKDLSQLAAQATAEEGRVTWRRRFVMMVEQSGLEVTPSRLLGIALAVGLGVGSVVTLVRGSFLSGLLASLLFGVIPILYIWWKRRQRINKLQLQLPEAFDLMARVIRAGQTMTQGLLVVADDFEKPISEEFATCYEQQNLGLSPEVALRDLARRTGLMEIKIFVLALLIQQQTGGNLAELLDKLATIMRDRARIKGKIRTLTAEGRFQAMILMAMPPFLLVVVLLVNPAYGSVLFQYPKLLIAMAISEALGGLWIRRIVNFDF
jgi:tight adherence protein B